MVRESNKLTAPVAMSMSLPSLDLAHAPSLSHDEALHKLSSNDLQERNLGAAALVKEAQSSEDVGKKDDVAYRLARADVGLPEARQLAETAVLSAEAASAASGDEGRATQEDFARNITLSRYWDTLGYVHSRMGETALAKQYIKRAWELDPQAYYGSHLARLSEEAGDTQEAVQIYGEALNSPGGEDLKKTLHERIQSLTGSAEVQLVHSSYTPLTGTAVAQQGSAFFDLVYAAGKQYPVVVFVSGTGALKPLVSILAKTGGDSFALPDSGPEMVVRRVEVTCKASVAGAKSGCQALPLSAHEARMLFRQ